MYPHAFGAIYAGKSEKAFRKNTIIMPLYQLILLFVFLLDLLRFFKFRLCKVMKLTYRYYVYLKWLSIHGSWCHWSCWRTTSISSRLNAVTVCRYITSKKCLWCICTNCYIKTNCSVSKVFSTFRCINRTVLHISKWNDCCIMINGCKYGDTIVSVSDV
jgi:hypothetical protein